MKIAAIVFFSLFVVASVINVVAGFFEREKLRKISKPFCLFFLSLSAFFFAPQAPFIYFGAFCGLLGDIVFLFKDKKICVGLGSGIFLIGHVLYIDEALLLIDQKTSLWSYSSTWIWMLVYGAVLLALSFYPVFRLTRHSPVFTPLGMLYSSTLLTDGAVAILGSALGLSSYLALMVVGDFFFIMSDSFLAHTLFVKDVKRRDFYIMLTYLLGQAFIVSGLLFTFLK